MPEPATVAICVATYKRPKGLAKLLRSLDGQTFAAAAPRLTIVVADNDPDRSAEPLVAAHKSPHELIYTHQPVRGISQARNASVAAAPADAEWLVFIDDDEHAEPDWLDTLLSFQRETGADVVAGPIIAHLPDDAPGWAKRGRFFQRERFPTGTPRNRAYTNNTLARAAVVRSMDPIFDESAALRGGADTFLFRRIHDAGHTILWCDEAIVHEDIPRTRITTRWICRRAYRVGANIADHAIKLEGPLRGRARTLAIALARSLQGAVCVLPALVLGKHHAVRQLRWIAYAAGLTIGAFGRHVSEYETHHGD